MPEARFPRRTLLGNRVNRGNGAALSRDCPGIYERREGFEPSRANAHPPARPPPKTSPDRRRTFPRERAWLALRLRCAWFFFSALNVPTCSYRPLPDGRSTTVQLSSPC